ncbi:MAG: rhomboid family intramembrane serine protease [Planctomycetes bacterium]|nr:rhomboid family intramembrane serine protease [Planctomycetota bacterium]
MSIYNRDYMRENPRGIGALVQGWRAVEVFIAINALVFLVWTLFADPRQPQRLEFLDHHFVVGIGTLRSGKLWTLVTYMFSHKELMHLVLNMFVLWSFGRVVEAELGTRRFVTFYLISGVVAGLVHSLLSLVGWPPNPALGASGAISAVVMLFCMAHPREKLLLFFVIPMPAFMLAVLFVGFDLYGLVQQFNGNAWENIGHGAHLGGAACGLLLGLHVQGRIRLPWVDLGPRSRRRRRSRSAEASALRPRRSDHDERRMDELLKKVHDGGLDSLSPDEREWMIDQSKRYRDRT